MRYSDPKLLEMLAAEYVIGTLRGAARARFEGLMRYRADIRQRVSYWENQFLAGAVNEFDTQPPNIVWQSIEARLVDISSSKTPSSPKKLFWPTWSVLATAACAALLVTVMGMQKSLNDYAARGVTNHVGVVGQEAAPLWVISADLQSGQLSAKAINASARSIDQAFELWMLPSDGQPISVGLLPVDGGVVTHNLSPTLMVLLRESKGLAVSIEPAGGSPTGLPTGEVIETAKIWAL